MYSGYVQIKNTKKFNCFPKVFKVAGTPLNIKEDNCSELTFKIIYRCFQECGVTFFTTTNDDVKCVLVERQNRTIKKGLWVCMNDTAELLLMR